MAANLDNEARRADAMVDNVDNSVRPARFGVVGAGWRAEFFFRIAEALPERFQVTGVVTRDPARRERVRQEWGYPLYDNLDGLLEGSGMDFTVVSVPRAAAPPLLELLSQRRMPALCETPPAQDLEGMALLWEWTEGGRGIQVAEQYAFQPLHAARIAIAQGGLLGTVSQAQVSAAHGYHGVSLLRRFLGIGFEDCAIRARAFDSTIVQGPGRAGPPSDEQITASRQVIAQLDFDGQPHRARLGVYDFTGDQYFSWVRSPRLLVRGERGEIKDREVRYLRDFRTPVELELHRVNAGEDGNLEGYYLKGYLAGQDWVYQNPFIPARLTDDEIAVATCLEKMAIFARGGPAFYSLAEASQDHYLALLIDQAVQTGAEVRSAKQPWAG